MNTKEPDDGLDLERLKALEKACEFDPELSPRRRAFRDALEDAAPALIEAAQERDDFLGQIQAYRESAAYFEAQKVMERENAANTRIAELEAQLDEARTLADEVAAMVENNLRP